MCKPLPPPDNSMTRNNNNKNNNNNNDNHHQQITKKKRKHNKNHSGFSWVFFLFLMGKRQRSGKILIKRQVPRSAIEVGLASHPGSKNSPPSFMALCYGPNHFLQLSRTPFRSRNLNEVVSFIFIILSLSPSLSFSPRQVFLYLSAPHFLLLWPPCAVLR